ncbi:MAG: sulfite exporter TauE/SafE family protein [Burkholderiales bacterium]
MTLDLALIALGAFLAALVVGAAGFAFAVVANGLWAHALPPSALVLFAAVLATLLHSVVTWKIRRAIEWRRLAPFLLGSLVGVPIGAALLTRIDPVWFRHILGVCLIGYVVLALVRPASGPLRLGAGAARAADGGIGWLGGVIGGVTAMHGTLPALWCQNRGWDKAVSRGVLQPYIFFTNILVMLWVGSRVTIEPQALLWPMVVALPAMAAGLMLGWRIFEVVSEPVFRRLVLGLIFCSGVALQF